MRIRQAMPGDADGMAALMLGCQAMMPDRSMYVIDSARLVRDDLASGRRFGYVAVDGGGIASLFLFAIGDGHAPRAVVEAMAEAGGGALLCDIVATRPGSRSRGLASTLLAEGISRGRMAGCRVAWAAVDPRNASSLSMFAKAGFGALGEEEMFAGAGDGYVIGGSGDAQGAPVTRRILSRRI